MYCKNCGSYLDSEDSAKFCSNCGFTISSSQPAEKVAFTNKSNSYNPTPRVNSGVSVNDLKSYSQIIGIIQLLIGGFLFVGSLILLLARTYAVRNVSQLDVSSVKSFNLGMNILLGLGILLMLFGVLVLISGIGILKGKKWSRISSMIVGGLSLFSFPLGTLFGVFTLYYLSKPEIDQVLSN